MAVTFEVCCVVLYSQFFNKDITVLWSALAMLFGGTCSYGPPIELNLKKKKVMLVEIIIIIGSL